MVSDSMSMSLLYVVFFAIGTAETLYDSSTAAWLPTLVESKDLAWVNGRLQTTYVICNEFVGPRSADSSSLPPHSPPSPWAQRATWPRCACSH
ncbi:hypothetical protein [Streptomyces sp. NPDC059761]|uniref:hypothetical protein n=1 Tax=Streptomyces sp. NPDC059761 TaxID=3346937 RepID=UPI003661F926